MNTARGWHKAVSTITALGVVLGSLGSVLVATPVAAASVSSATFTGGAGTASVSGALYAKQGAALTLTVVTSSDTKCVDVTGAAALPRQTSSTAKTNWTFTTTAPAGNGAQAFTVAASPNFNANNCTGQTNSAQASYTLDNTGPAVSAALTPAANDAGWNNGDVTVKWTATDAGSGVAAAQPFKSDHVTANGIATVTASGQTDRVGNTGAGGSVTVRVDKAAPAISASETKNADGTSTISFTCTDSNSGGGESSGIASCVAEGTSPTSASKTVQPGATVKGAATDVAGNQTSITVTATPSDTTAPTITGGVTPTPNAAGWNKADATVTFTCADNTGGSGVKSCVADGTSPASASKTVSTETNGTAVSGTATDNAGNIAKSTVTVKLDKTAPSISAAADRAPNAAGWYNADVTVRFTADDALSGIANKTADKVLAEGANQAAQGTATDHAGNGAGTSLSGINIDKTAPVLSAAFSTAWHTGDVVVDWSCTDALSGPAGQPADETVTGEGDNLSSTASCTDKAGNTATKTVSGIKIDRTAPVTTASVAEANDAGWYGDDVLVTLSGSDSLSGVAATHYSVDGGTVQTYTSPFSVGEGQHSLTYWSKDNAGNLEEAGAPLQLKVDKTAPTTTVINPISPDSGWFVTSGIPVAFEASDAGSGIAVTYYTIDGGEPQTYGKPFTADLSTGVHTITYWSVDIAGNDEAKDSVKTTQVKVDTIAPSITGSQAPKANDAGWNNTPVDVTFTCTDADSGINGVAGCAGDTTLSNDGKGQVVKGDAVDVAGNRSTTNHGPVNIDQTKPTLVGVPADGNGAGWHQGDVTVTWVGDDALSGIEPATQPAPSTITGEGSNLGAGPVTIKDTAGNTSDPASVSGIKIDRTAPVVAGAATTSPNAAGWYRNEVVVDFRCTDALSGVAYCPTSKLLKSDGADQSVTSDPAKDVAGNVSAGKTVGGINIDGAAPTTSANNTCTPENGYCKGDTADVVLTATDQAGLSGVKEIRYSIDGGAEQVAASSSTTVQVPLSGSGAGTIKYWAVDNAGNAETANAIALKWDNIAPTVSHSLSPAPNADDWNNSDVTVTFTAKDDDKGSGVAGVTGPVTVSTETAGQVVTGTAKDTAGNVGTDSVTVKLDKTRPTISGAVTSGGTKTASGWYAGPVTVTFTCTDNLSRVATCPDPVVLSANGANTATGTATDKAGNTATATVSGIQIDQEKPTLTTADVNVQGQTYTLGAVPAATCTATDSFSGVASCSVKVAGGNASGVGTFAWTATAIDKAGNTSTVSGSYRVVYKFGGFLQPINDTAHQVGTSTSIFKGGSTVPAKLQLRRSDGTVVQAATAPTWLTPVKGSSTSAPVDENAYSAGADSGTTYRYDAAAQQYIYNWKTGTGGSYWRIGVKLDDGQTYYVNIGLR